MTLITYETPDIDSHSLISKPMALENKSFPYNDIADHRRFEELLYSLYYNLINTSEIKNYDKISLMSGVQDKGRDCALFTCGKSTGIIQCKKYQNNLSKQQFGEEITKFILYSLLDPKLLSDRNDFTYYIAVSTGFVLECSDFIDNFNALICYEKDLQKWIVKNLKQPTLKILELNNVYDDVRDILSKIKVLKIMPNDLDSLLISHSCQHLIPLFFQVRTIIDDSSIHNVQRTIKDHFSNVLEEPKIKEELIKGSSGLRIENNQLEDVPDSHIERYETQELIDWIMTDAERDKLERDLNICLLAGNAGMGKTVILKDLYDKLNDLNIPVLGLKADKLQSSNLLDLQNKIGLAIPVIDFIEQCKQKYNKTVILIDQIDALSQSMSSDRDYLHVFKSIIDKFTFDSNVRIIISIRIFDLYYDPSLRIYKNLKTVQVSLLTEDQVIQILKKINIERSEISGKLLQLLQTPNHLNIFSRLALSSKPDYSITSLQSLYTELYKLKILSIDHQLPFTSVNLKKLLFKIARKMFADQAISISEHHFEDYIKELNYLESERLIKKEGKQIQFFHQTFYDFIFAKNFVEKRKKLLEYIFHQDQSILIRSAVKMIVSYLREYDQRLYLKELQNIFSENKLLFHIKHMIYSWLLYQENPTYDEIDLVSKIGIKDMNFKTLFFEHARADTWLNVAVEEKLMDFLLNEPDIIQSQIKNIDYHKNNIIIFLRNYANRNIDLAWDFILKINDQSVKRSILFNIINWSNNKSFELFEQCEDFLEKDPFGYYHTLQNIAKIKPIYSFKKIEKNLLSNQWEDNSRQTVHQEKELLKSLSKTIPWKLINPLINGLIRDLLSCEPTYKNINDDQIYTQVNLDYKNSLQGKDYSYWLLSCCLREAAKTKRPEFKKFLKNYQLSHSEALLRLVINAIKSNESLYSNEVYSLFLHLFNNKHFITSSDLGVEFRDIFEKSFSSFDTKQQNDVLNKIWMLKVPSEARIWNFGPKPKTCLLWGKSQHALLRRIPRQFLEKDQKIKKLSQELQRKFPEFIETYNSSKTLAGMVRRPIKDTAYEKMTVKQWINSFRKYRNGHDPFQEDYLKGGLHEHSWAFRDQVKKQPNADKVVIIDQSIGDKTINISYPLLGMLGLTEVSYDPEVIYYLLKKITPHVIDLMKNDHYLRVAIYLIESKIDDDNLVKLLIECALEWSDSRKNESLDNKKTSIDDLISKGLNTCYGTAASALLYINQTKYEEIVFTTIKRILYHGPREIKALLLYRFAYLNKINRSRSFELFTEYLSYENDIYITASAIWSLQYMGNHDFSRLVPIFERLTENIMLGENDSKWLFSILYFSYLFEKVDADRLVFLLIKTNHYCRIWSVREIFKHYYLNENTPFKANALLHHLLELEKIDPSENFEIYYENFDHLKLRDIDCILEVFIKLPHFRLSESLLKYLTAQCNKYPFIAIKIFNQAIERDSLQNLKGNGISNNKEIIKFILGAFNALKGNDPESKIQRRVLLEAFDSILKDFRYRYASERILEELI